MNIRKLAAISGVAVMTLGAAGAVSAASVVPTSHEGNITASGEHAARCPDGSAAIDVGGGVAYGYYGSMNVHVIYHDDDSIDFHTEGGTVSVAFVKGGDGYNKYAYSPAVTADDNLVSPLNGGQNVPEVSHTVWCVTEDDAEETEEPTKEPTQEPTSEPTQSVEPTQEPTSEPTQSVEPTSEPTQSVEPTTEPSQSTEPTTEPTPSDPPEESEEPTSTPSEGVEGETDVPTAPPTDTLGSSSTSQTGGALPILLIVLGFISLAAVVVTPARNRR